MKSKAFFLVLAALLLAAPALSAAQPTAVLTSLKGKVEVKAPGATAWTAATEGQVLSPAVTLSTGFDSSVVVVIDKTTIQVKPLTRMTIDKLVSAGGTVKTSTFLRVGSVSASVKSAEGVKQDLKVQSPYSTASVRGTEFDYDGLRLKVSEGLVAFALGQADRETQPEATPAAAEGDGTTPPAADPPADNPNEVFVPAGKEIKVELNFKDGGASAKTPNAKDELKADQPPLAPGGPKTFKGGSVTVSIHFVD